MTNLRWSRGIAACVILSLVCLTGCPNKPAGTGGDAGKGSTAPASGTQVQALPKAVSQGTASADDVKAAKARIDALGSRSKYTLKDGDRLTEIVIPDGSNLTADDLLLFARLRDLEKLQVFNCRALNDEMAASLSGLKGLTSLALTNTTINDKSVEMIVKSFPNLLELDLSSNTNMSNGVVKLLGGLEKLQRLTLVQNKVNDIGARRLEKLKELRSLDLRGNMEAGDMALEVVAELPKLTGFKHRSTAVTDSGLEYLSRNQTLDSLLMQDFVITDMSGPHLAKLGKLTQLEVFRCQGFGTEGVLALKGMNLTRLTLRDLPNIDDRAMEVFDDFPKLRRLYLHELTSVGDSGLKHLASLASLELLDIWTVPQLTDTTLDVIAALPHLKELSLRATGITDASIDKLLGMPSLQTLTFKENGSITADGLKKLSTKKWVKLDLGTADSNEPAAP